MSRMAILVDFDGVLHSYTSAWAGATMVSDPPVDGAIEWLTRLVRDGRFEVCIYSSRSREEGGVEAMKDWFHRHGIPIDVHRALKYPTEKPAAWLTIDDRAFAFEGTFPDPQWIEAFKPWNKR